MDVETHLFVEAKSDPRGHAIHINMITAMYSLQGLPRSPTPLVNRVASTWWKGPFRRALHALHVSTQSLAPLLRPFFQVSTYIVLYIVIIL